MKIFLPNVNLLVLATKMYMNKNDYKWKAVEGDLLKTHLTFQLKW